MTRSLLTIILAVAAASCSGWGRRDQEPMTVAAIAYALGGKGDQSYNDAADVGRRYLERMGVGIIEFQPATLEDYDSGLELLANRTPRVIFCVGFLYEPSVQRIAARYRGTVFVVLDGSIAAPDNVASVRFLAGEAAYLAGAAAATRSRTKRLGFVGGADIPVINEFRDGFERGAHTVDSSVRVLHRYIGAGGTAFTDPVKGREVAGSLIGSGADVLFAAAGSSGNGVIKAAQERELSAIGVDVDQSHLAPATVMTSVLKRFDVVMPVLMRRVLDGEQIGGLSHRLGLRDSAVGLSPIVGADSLRLKAAVETAAERLFADSLDHR